MTDNVPDMIVRYVPVAKVEAYLALGWVAHYGSFNGTHFQGMSVLMEWPVANGEPIEPSKEQKK